MNLKAIGPPAGPAGQTVGDAHESPLLLPALAPEDEPTALEVIQQFSMTRAWGKP